MKKAILIVSFGTTHEDTRKATIDVIESRIKKEFEGYEVKMCYTSHIILKRLKENYGIYVDTPEEALNKLADEGYEEVYLQPLHLIPGEEFDYIKKVTFHQFLNKFKVIKIGRPLLYFKSEEEDIPDDYTILLEAMNNYIPKDRAVVLMGHGSAHPSNSVYSCFESVLVDEGYDKVYMATVEGYPTLDRAIKFLNKNNHKKVTLMPFMFVAGDHAKHDMAGDEEDSWKVILSELGFDVDIILKGIGEFPEVQDIYIEHLHDIIEGKYCHVGKTKKGMKKRK
ncbi:sirohydrochlorin cobaltochelatase [Clostridium collagenovorans DSM 3089]|uniref:Sirohydrochlorin cobaltochelatase n=1 Tax=Clostridium collagenovorans DSM 3089 TaxID=1121306 RepID=A0A1M5TWH1_9CLOT|nr:sirohydrochlorin cobaltochelatase [Clostridium collagenovorans]SHH55175.1 sirohydrochlorin cobaltochelatase [Clostridium collagenovorans DSM 3089]